MEPIRLEITNIENALDALNDLYTAEACSVMPDLRSCCKEKIAALVADEEEAIAGYDEFINFLNGKDIDGEEREELLRIISHIREEEVEHISELNAMCANMKWYDKSCDINN